MGKFIGLLISTVIFSALPALLLLLQYNIAIAVAYFAISLTILSVFWELTEIRDNFKKKPTVNQESILSHIDSKLNSIEICLAEINASATSIERDVSEIQISQLPEYPPDAPYGA